MSMQIAKILLDPRTDKKTYKKVLKNNNMRITNKFSPVISQYRIEISPIRRFILTMTNNQYTFQELKFRYGKWQEISSFSVKGTLEYLEKALETGIRNITELKNRLPKKFPYMKQF